MLFYHHGHKGSAVLDLFQHLQWDCSNFCDVGNDQEGADERQDWKISHKSGMLFKVNGQITIVLYWQWWRQREINVIAKNKKWKDMGKVDGGNNLPKGCVSDAKHNIWNWQNPPFPSVRVGDIFRKPLPSRKRTSWCGLHHRKFPSATTGVKLYDIITFTQNV